MPKVKSPTQRKRANSKSAPAPRGGASSRVVLDAGPINDFVGYRLRLAQLTVYDDFVRGQSGDSPLTPQLFGTLVLIDRNPELTQQQLCDAIGVDKSTLVVTLHRLADRGLIKRVRSTKDRRQNALRLTAKGTARLRAMTTYSKQHEKKITSQLSEAEVKQLMELLVKVMRSVWSKKARALEGNTRY